MLCALAVTTMTGISREVWLNFADLVQAFMTTNGTGHVELVAAQNELDQLDHF